MNNSKFQRHWIRFWFGILTLCVVLLIAAFTVKAQQNPPAPPQGIATTTTKTAYYCGAKTKAGTPCKHRVKHQGERCWQHKGAK